MTAMPDKRFEMGAYVLIEAGADMRDSAPARRRGISLGRLGMKPWLIAGILVAALGVVVLTRGIRYPSHHSSLRIGDVEASVQEQRAVPTWVGVAAVAAGAVMIGAGLRARKT
jgi:hypothetical protein